MDAVETGINMVQLDINNTMATISRQHKLHQGILSGVTQVGRCEKPVREVMEQ